MAILTRHVRGTVEPSNRPVWQRFLPSTTSSRAHNTAYQDVPFEIWIRIAHLLPAESLIALALSCWTLYNTFGPDVIQILQLEPRYRSKYLVSLRKSSPYRYYCRTCSTLHQRPRLARHSFVARSFILRTLLSPQCKLPYWERANEQTVRITNYRYLRWRDAAIMLEGPPTFPHPDFHFDPLRGEDCYWNGSRRIWTTRSASRVVKGHLLFVSQSHLVLDDLRRRIVTVEQDLLSVPACIHFSWPNARTLVDYCYSASLETHSLPEYRYDPRIQLRFRCGHCPSEYVFRIVPPGKLGDFDINGNAATCPMLQITRFVDCGMAKPFPSKQWLALIGCGTDIGDCEQASSVRSRWLKAGKHECRLPGSEKWDLQRWIEEV